MAIVNYYEQKPLIIFTFKKLCNGELSLTAQHSYKNVIDLVYYSMCVFLQLFNFIWQQKNKKTRKI